MIYEILKAVVATCGAVLVVSLTLVTLKLAWSFLRSNKDVYGKEVVTTVSGSTDGNPSNKNLWETITKTITPVPMPKPTVAPVEVKPALQPNAFTLMCGKCQKKITSQPVDVRVVNGKSEVRYKCEHCGSTVAVKS
jgi:hypothetical protein